ncbi:MAG: hypothetical protein K5648_04805 [Erysipelotrichaceae bacterium]|nr:hypothetical protein [Erysipelotrichaceae bacterium]
MKNKNMEKIIIAVTAVFVIVTLLIVFGGKMFPDHSGIKKGDSTVMTEATNTTNEIKKGIVVEQDFINSTDSISKVGIVFTRFAYREGIRVAMELLEGEKVLAATTLDTAKFEDQHRTYIEPAARLSGMKNKKLTIRIYPVDKEDTGLMIMMNKDADVSFRFGNKTIKGTLCFSVSE